MASPADDDREIRTTQLALGAALGVAVAALGFALWLRYGPPRAGESGRPGRPAAAAPANGADELSVMTAAATPAESVPAPEAAARPEPASPPVATDVVLLPCSEPNPRPDGRFLIPPHDPTHRTIVGLPSGPGEPRRGLVIPPHDPAVENRVTVQFVPLDSILETTIRIPPHDPAKFKLISPDSVPCIR
ncbi:MAG TPA: hypothetical protein VHJ69_04620 [Gemmatimonadales bacterium]|jgi:hypothetical protein|nr:hypothetical protein [Gemmatimonadales bacterium]